MRKSRRAMNRRKRKGRATGSAAWCTFGRQRTRTNWARVQSRKNGCHDQNLDPTQESASCTDLSWYDSLDVVFGRSFIVSIGLAFLFFSIFSSLPTCPVGLTDESLLICVYKRKSSMLSLHHFSSFINVRLQFMDISFSDCLSFIVQSLFSSFFFWIILAVIWCALCLLVFCLTHVVFMPLAMLIWDLSFHLSYLNG